MELTQGNNFLINFMSIRECTDCQLFKTRKNCVIGRGTGNWNGKVLFMGEAPGKSEDVIGEPFVDASGKLLNKMIAEAGIDSYYITSTILCIPLNNGEVRPPASNEVLACRNNIEAIFKFINPKAIVFIGKVAQNFYKEYFPVREFHLIHPSAILRRGMDMISYKSNIKILKQVKEVIDA